MVRSFIRRSFAQQFRTDFIKNPRLFSNRKVPVINVDARQYPVTVHFSKKTRVDDDPIKAAYKKVRNTGY